MPNSIDIEYAFEIYLASLVIGPPLVALLVAIFAQASYKYGTKGRPYAEMLLIIAGSYGSGFLALRTFVLAGMGPSDAGNLAGLVGLLTFGVCFWALYAFSSANPPVWLLRGSGSAK